MELVDVVDGFVSLVTTGKLVFNTSDDIIKFLKDNNCYSINVALILSTICITCLPTGPSQS